MNKSIKKCFTTIYTIILYRIKVLFRQIKPVRILSIGNNQQGNQKRVLVSYLPSSVLWKENDSRFNYHSNSWECRQIVRLFADNGFIVDVISYLDQRFKLKNEYDVIFDINKNLIRYSTPITKYRIMHCTGSNPRYSNKALLERIENLRNRKGRYLNPRRLIPETEIESFERNLEFVTHITLLGNEITKNTYSKNYHDKIFKSPVTGSILTKKRDIERFIPKKEFLWFGGSGAVHKGLDLVLEVFQKHAELFLHVVGPYEQERDFVETYSYELYHCPNIKSHGYLSPSSPEFFEITKNVIGHILPSCSEATSSAAITCMQFGLLPILSINCGVSIIEGENGFLLKTCSLNEIESAILKVCDLNEVEIKTIVNNSQECALSEYSHDGFSQSFDILIKDLKQVSI